MSANIQEYIRSINRNVYLMCDIMVNTIIIIDTWYSVCLLHTL